MSKRNRVEVDNRNITELHTKLSVSIDMLPTFIVFEKAKYFRLCFTEELKPRLDE